MSFPTVTARGSARDAGDVTSHPITLPTHAAGDGLLVHFACDGSSGGLTLTGNWVEVQYAASDPGNVSSTMFWLVAGSASETLTVTTGNSQEASHTVLVITPTAGYYLPTPTATGIGGDSANSNPPLHTPSAGTQDYLWVATRAGDGTTVATAAPASFTDLQTLAAANGTGASTNTAERSVNGSSLNPGSFTSATEQWACLTVSIYEAELKAGFLAFFI
jgi:hypothetical protein